MIVDDFAVKVVCIPAEGGGRVSINSGAWGGQEAQWWVRIAISYIINAIGILYKGFYAPR